MTIDLIAQCNICLLYGAKSQC